MLSLPLRPLASLPRPIITQLWGLCPCPACLSNEALSSYRAGLVLELFPPPRAQHHHLWEGKGRADMKEGTGGARKKAGKLRNRLPGCHVSPHTPPALLTGVRGLVLAVPLKLKDVYFHPGLGWDLDDPVDLLPGQSQGQTLTAATHCLVVQDCS